VRWCVCPWYFEVFSCIKLWTVTCSTLTFCLKTFERTQRRSLAVSLFLWAQLLIGGLYIFGESAFHCGKWSFVNKWRRLSRVTGSDVVLEAENVDASVSCQLPRYFIGLPRPQKNCLCLTSVYTSLPRSRLVWYG